MREAPPAEALFLSCTNIHSLPVLELLEARLGKPVVSSNQAVLWYALQLAGESSTIEGLGRLPSLKVREPAYMS
jgi:maleate isomerase